MKSRGVLKDALWSVATFSAIVAASPIHKNVRRGNWTIGQMVDTSSGPVIGHAATDANQVSEYLGIPYAMPPIGNLRFQSPVKYINSSTINATNYGASCIYPPSGSSNSNIGNSGSHSEDCLTLNVWTKPQTGEAKKAVMVWIYGGAYVIGTSSNPTYTGKFIANENDVVVVSMNYRLNVFGFPGNPATPANLGLRDVRLAVEWVRDNIAEFGGDVDRITIFGQSAGAGLVDFYSFGYESDPIANGFIEMSATVEGFPAIDAQSTHEKWFNMTVAVGCGNSTSDPIAVTECMTNKTTSEILAGFSPADAGVGTTPNYGPTVDDVLVFASYSSRVSAKGGYLIGNTQNEAGLFRSFQPNHTDLYWDTFNNVSYTCADARRTALSIAQGNPTWRYRYFGDFPNLSLNTIPPSGAYHTADLPPLFNTVPQSIIPSTPQEVAIGNYIRGAWATFAKDPAKGLLTYGGGWPIYNPTETTLIRTGFENQTGPSLSFGNAYDSTC